MCIEQRGVLAQFEHGTGEVVRALAKFAWLAAQPVGRRLRFHLAVAIAVVQSTLMLNVMPSSSERRPEPARSHSWIFVYPD